jgi:nitrogen fixation NifU-like protein
MDLRILEIASNTENNKVLDNFTHQSKNKNAICGDEMEISLVVKNDKVIDMGYQCKSCIYCQASVSLLSQKIKNKNIQEIKNFVISCENIFENTKTLFEKNWKDFLELFNKKNVTRKECLLLPIRTVLKALKI